MALKGLMHRELERVRSVFGHKKRTAHLNKPPKTRDRQCIIVVLSTNSNLLIYCLFACHNGVAQWCNLRVCVFFVFVFFLV